VNTTVVTNIKAVSTFTHLTINNLNVLTRNNKTNYFMVLISKI